MNRRDTEPPFRARVHADVERPDKIVFGLTFRQLVILTVTGLILYGVWSAAAAVVDPTVVLVAAVPVAAAAFLLAVGRRDGIGLDSWLVAAIRHRRAPHRLVPTDGAMLPAPAWVTTTNGPGHRQPLPAPLSLPAKGITDGGLIDLGPDGSAAVVAASTVNFGLRTPAEQNGLVAGLARWLNSLDAPVQILIRAQRVDLSSLAERIADRAPGLPHPALEEAALAHAAFLDQLATERELLHRQVTVTVRDRRGPGYAQHRAAETARALAACEVDAQVCDGPATAAVLAACLDPAVGPATDIGQGGGNR